MTFETLENIILFPHVLLMYFLIERSNNQRTTPKYLGFLLFFVGNFDPKAMNNFYDHIEPGPVVPPKPSKKGE